MPLTPQDVRNKLFTSVRLRPGYDEDEVDAFLDEVEQELARLHAEIEQLQGSRGPAAEVQVAAARDDADSRARAALEEVGVRHAQELESVRTAHEQSVAGVRAEVEAVRREAEARIAQAAQQVQAYQQQVQQLQQQLDEAERQAAHADEQPARVQQRDPEGSSYLGPGPASPSGPDTSMLPPPSPTEDALRRTLLLAQRTADEAVAEARAEAHRIVSEAKRHVVETARRAEAEHGAAMSRARAEYETLAAKVEELRGFERDYRSRLRAYLHLQLRDLEAGAPEPSQAVAAAARGALTDGSLRPGGDAPAAAETAPSAPAGTPAQESPQTAFVGPASDEDR